MKNWVVYRVVADVSPFVGGVRVHYFSGFKRAKQWASKHCKNHPHGSAAIQMKTRRRSWGLP